MTNQELLFNLIKKLESGEIKLGVVDSSPTTIRITLYEKGRQLETPEEFTKEIEIGNLEMEKRKGTLPIIRQQDYQEEWNEEFKENFYQEKGLAKCWYKDCPNQIFKSGLTQGVVNPVVDYKAVNIECKDKHKRYVCLECYASKISK